MLMRMFVANEVAQLGGWLDWVAITLGRFRLPYSVAVRMRVREEPQFALQR